jgi:hypothetical protein
LAETKTGGGSGSRSSSKKDVKRPLVILGTAASMTAAPFEDEDTEIWAVQTASAKEGFQRADRLFEMHPRRYWGEPGVTARINETGLPVYMQDHYDEIPKSVRYPYEEIREKFYLPVMKENLFVTNTITWMLLLAIHEGYRDISLFGVHMAHETEYGYQQASCSWALGIIHGMMLQGEKFNLYIVPSSELLTARYEYGYGEPTQAMQWVNSRILGMQRGIQEANQKLTELEKSKLKTEGAVSELKNVYAHLAGFK